MQNVLNREQKSAKARKLSDMKDGKVPPSAWDILRWIVASNTSEHHPHAMLIALNTIQVTFARSMRSISCSMASLEPIVNSASSLAIQRKRLYFAKRPRRTKQSTPMQLDTHRSLRSMEARARIGTLFFERVYTSPRQQTVVLMVSAFV